MFDFALLLRFFIVWCSTAFLFLGIGYILVEKAGMEVALASTTAYVVAFCYNYALHYHWTYVSEAPHGRALIRYLSMCAGSMCLNALVMHFGFLMTSWPYIAVQLLAGVVIISWTLTVNFFWTFRRN